MFLFFWNLATGTFCRRGVALSCPATCGTFATLGFWIALLARRTGKEVIFLQRGVLPRVAKISLWLQAKGLPLPPVGEGERARRDGAKVN
jgi:hypothetical protein